jgi:hypothetical protein
MGPDKSAGIIYRISMSQGISDLNSVSDILKLRVYLLTLKEIFNILGFDLFTLQEEILFELKDGLREIINGFFYLISDAKMRDLNLNQVNQTIQKAYSHMNAALSIYEQDTKTFEYFDHLQECRQYLYISIEQLDSITIPEEPALHQTAIEQDVTSSIEEFGEVLEKGNESEESNETGQWEEFHGPEIENETRHAPRVLNANFAEPDQAQQRVLEPYDGLVAGQEYDLLLDVGPRWKSIKSIVTGQANFPEYALPPDQEGYIVQVVVVSEDFSPNMVSAQIWLPRQTGSSFPFENSQQAEKPGPVALHLQAPRIPPDNDTKAITAHARLCLYYENNLLQSAVVKVGVVPASGTRLDEANTINVDYVLSSTFQELEERFAKRAVKFYPADDNSGHPVTLNLTINDDGANGHRIIISHRIGNNEPYVQPQQITCPPRGWTPYKPEEAKILLENSRNRLQSFFYQRDKKYAIVKDENQNPVLWHFENHQNGKTKVQFMRDLFLLATLGRELYIKALLGVNPEGATCGSIEWMQNLEKELTFPSVIQVSGMNQHDYVFPWALMYSYPMDSPKISKWTPCKIFEEWADNGMRTTQDAKDKKLSVCPYHPRGSKNIVCPYGFWGLKHIIEQPPSVLIQGNNKGRLRDADNKIQTNAKFGLSIGVTRDQNLKINSIDEHLEKLKKLTILNINPSQPAEDWEGVCTMLKAPEVVYFLCHGELDDKNMTYLSIGPHDDLPNHKIYPLDLDEWALGYGPDIESWWKKRHPLIFINGCHTVNLKPGQILDFVSTFINGMEASGVLGTEVSVLLPVAIEVAESLFVKLGQKKSVGQALYEIRWDLANKGNLLGLAYTLYGLADLHIVDLSVKP